MDKVIGRETREKFALPENFWSYSAAGISGIFLIFSWFGLFKEMLGFDPAWIAIVLCGMPIIKEALKELFICREITADALVSIALFAAVYIGEYFAAGEVAFIMMIGELLEERTLAKARASIQKLLWVLPPVATVRREGKDIEIPAKEIAVDDIVLVKPGEFIPVDGVIISGNSSVNQSAITGESLPVDKTTGEEVYIGTVNLLGALEIRATKVGEDSTLAKVIKLVEEAEHHKAPIVRVADRWAAYMVPAALLFALIVYLLTGNIIRAVTILIVFCPCALCLATPTAMMAGIGNAAKNGILVKSGYAMETAGKVNSMIFDKTGTLTHGKPVVVEIKEIAPYTPDKILWYFAITEKFSEHPLSRAVFAKAKEKGLSIPDPDSFTVRLGHGVEAAYKGECLLAGNLKLMKQENISFPPEFENYIHQGEEKGQTVLILAINHEIAGAVSVSDPVKEEVSESVKSLHNYGIKNIWLLTGDNPRTAAAIAKKAGITQFKANQLPVQKGEMVQDLKEQGHSVAMVGDGINDAPALAMADVGIAMGAGGTDVAIQTADITLMTSDMRKILRLVELSRQTLKTIYSNLSLAMVINFIAMLMASFGLIGPIMGALVHNAGSVLVIANSGRLIYWKGN